MFEFVPHDLTPSSSHTASGCWEILKSELLKALSEVNPLALKTLSELEVLKVLSAVNSLEVHKALSEVNPLEMLKGKSCRGAQSPVRGESAGVQSPDRVRCIASWISRKADLEPSKSKYQT